MRNSMEGLPLKAEKLHGLHLIIIFTQWTQSLSPPFLHTGYELDEAINSPTHGEPNVMPDQQYYPQWFLMYFRKH